MTIQNNLLKPTPWDQAALGMPTWELLEYSEEALQQSSNTHGHHTIKVNPLSNKRLLHDFGFYYCDTLIEPICDAKNLRQLRRAETSISRDINSNNALIICHGAFTHGRFHRDFKLAHSIADRRYDNWLNQMIEEHRVFGLYWNDELAGFIGYHGNALVLHAVSEKYRGRGFAKYWWSMACTAVLDNGNELVTSSISASNTAVLNLYVSLGFSFGKPLDVYHRTI